MRNFYCDEIEHCEEDCRFCDRNSDFKQVEDSYQEFKKEFEFYRNGY